MSVLKVLGIALATTVLASTYANALTVTNRDTAAHTVYIKMGDQESEHAIPAGESVDTACEESCAVRLSGVEESMPAENADRLVIEDGALSKEQSQ